MCLVNFSDGLYKDVNTRFAQNGKNICKISPPS